MLQEQANNLKYLEQPARLWHLRQPCPTGARRCSTANKHPTQALLGEDVDTPNSCKLNRQPQKDSNHPIRPSLLVCLQPLQQLYKPGLAPQPSQVLICCYLCWNKRLGCC